MRRSLLRTCAIFWSILFAVQLTMAQSRMVSGVVRDNEGRPLPGVTVKSGAYTVTTNEEGTYEITIADQENVLSFSSLGLKSQQISVNNRSTIDAVLLSTALDLDDVVVVGYGGVRKSDLTGAVATLKGSDLNKTPASSVDQLLQGKIPGVQVAISSGQPGAGATVRIRGNSSLSGSNAPLVVVDGFPWGDAGDLKQINPEDIESIEVLKDASSAAIYGSRGANGVIMVTTKKARAGTPRISLNTLNTVSTLSVKPDLWRDGIEEAVYANEAALNGGTPLSQLPYLGEVRSGVYFPSIAELRGLDPNKPQWATNTDWADLVYRNPFSQNYTLGIDGGAENTKYSMSGNYYKEEGLAIKNAYDKYTGRLNLDQKLTNAISAGTNIILTYTNNTGQNLSAGRSRIFPVYDENGNYFRTSAMDFGNPIAIANEVLNKSKTIDVLGTVFVSAKLTDWLQFRTQLSTKYGNSIGDVYEPANVTFRGYENTGYGAINNYNNNELVNENYLTIDKTFDDAHRLNVVGGFSLQNSRTRTSNLMGMNFVNDNLQNENLNSAKTKVLSNGLSASTLHSWFGRANYALLDKYLFTVTGRADGSTKFGENNKWAFFPSAAVAWKLNEESFIKDLNAFSELKLRASYGLTGNQGISPYQTLDRFGSERYYVGAQNGFMTGFGPGLAGANNDQGLTIVGGLGNKSLRWETTTSYDLGLDIGFMNQRFTLTLDYYDKHTKDLLRTRTISPSSGFDQQWVNDGEISNRGFELGFNAGIIQREELSWSVGGNFALNRNKVVAMGESDRVVTGSLIEMVRQNVNHFIIGQPMYAFYGYRSDGIIQSLEEGIEAGLTGAEAIPGEIKYMDIAGADGSPDGTIDPTYDRVVIGDPTPNFIYSFNTSVSYKRFDLNAQFYGVYGNDVFDLQKMTPSRQVQRWTPDNPSNLYPRANNTRGYKASDFFVEDGSFLRLQNVTLGYNFRPGIIKGISNIRLYASGNNLLTITKFNKGFDPEVGLDGINWGNYPRPRAYSFGVSVGF
ncbi:TonB-linked SusC/RagA family outer membrane protein [Sphingobacterium allocomposti]|uniref:TonB-linked SusC/RagA family outer membrane protein n=1 Tax=Sphingobacterium allocomposti TaxID=415956 RepID=A0A5S5CWW3_9SPHI|nr:TonB-dependent receptor [Sphingobacterium composti Yoo et al. 2007 non Ten et al. 2007]TYP87336.1 TonB-linked SusC/RagA family outer membrane protein [Sphingobacterium composti Yoo et al. 2007 non Ten et al. 2007]